MRYLTFSRLGVSAFVAAFVAIILALSALSLGAEPGTEIVGPTQSEPYRMLDHSITGAWESAIWEIVPVKAAVAATLIDQRVSADGKTVTWVAPPGAYTVEAILVNFTQKKISRVKSVVTIGPAPRPDPRPDPKPDPKPLPTPTVLWCVIVEESSQRTPAQAAVMASQEVRGLFPQGKFRVTDKDVGGADVRAYIDRAKGKPLPQLYLTDDAGNVHFEGVLPATVKDFVALVDKIKTGVKGGR